MIDFAVDGDSFKATIAQEGEEGQALSNVSYDPPRVHAELESSLGLAILDGELKERMISGDIQQSGLSGTFHLERVEVVAQAIPAPGPLHYKEEEVSFQNGEFTLTGTLTLPFTNGPHPAVILISGSGPQNRNSALLGFEIFRIIADQFTREGIAVLRYDDRGVGSSTGDILQATISDFSEDVLAAVELLHSRGDINGEQIGLLGHSEGGMVATLVDSKSDAIAFLVLLAGPAVLGADIILAQLELILLANGATDAEIEEQIGLQMRTFEAMRTGEGWDGIEAGLQQQILVSLEDMPVEQRQAITDVDEFVNSIVEGQLQSINSPWFQSLVSYDPAPDIEQITSPVLALFGELDLQVPAELNQKAVEQALEAGGNQDYTTVTLPRANHLFQESDSGSPAAYATLKKEFVPGFLDLITEWILERVYVSSVAP